MKAKIFYFLLGAIIFSSITAIAVTKINANEISYTDKSNNKITVDTALNNLYTEASNCILNKLNLTSDSVSYNQSSGNRISGRQTSLELQPGSYLIIGGYTFTDGSTTSNSSNASGDTTYPTIQNPSGTCNLISGRYVKGVGSAHGSSTSITVYACSFPETVTVTMTGSSISAHTGFTTSVSIQAIKLSQ